ncbi:MAG: beta-N-acetylhexosaminidase, partial [Planctomycetota bacterium]
MTRSPGGARLMIGLAGTIVDEEFARTLRETGAHSVILFARNLIDANQIIELTTSIRALVSWPLVIAIDQEGGVVVRLEKGITVFPGNMALGHTHDPEIAK